jgi:hypothetical protein
MGTKHKHYDVIVAWAAGEEIEIRDGSNGWIPWVVSSPPHHEDQDYRIKPKRVKKEGWVNVYGPSSACICPTKETADKHAAPHRKACVRIEWEEEA